MADLKITTTVDDVDQATAKLEELKVYPVERDPIACAKIAEVKKVVDEMSGGYIFDTFAHEISSENTESHYNKIDDEGNLVYIENDLDDGWTRFATKLISIAGKIGCLNIDIFSVFDSLDNAYIRVHYYNENIHRYYTTHKIVENGQVCLNSPIVFDKAATQIRIEGFYKLTGPASNPILKYIPSAIEFYKKSDDTYLSTSNAKATYQNKEKANADVEFSSGYEDNGTTLSRIGNTVMLCLCIDGQGETIGNISDDKFKPTEIVQQRIDSTSIVVILPNGDILIDGDTTKKTIAETITYLSN